ncbi:sporulation protein [Dactylosporangium sp. AC04546]|uniref:sporulation protein n=1 Tax=Dactylosporangium sp. AC04546 TaxID=2862460 RepID=UPI001EDEC09B|nr:sporulation protein [Dactylosporangium sp. AC04546]WVK86904.1 sporulation protein [Dactylosporangium sp. AC04546]
MVFKKLLASLGLGGVEVDTVIAAQPVTPGGMLTGQVNLRAKSDSQVTAVDLQLLVNGPLGEVELARHRVAADLHLTGGSNPSLPFTLPVPAHAPFTALYGHNLPGLTAGVRTHVTVASGTAKGDFDPVKLDASPVQQQIMDALGIIGARFVRSELRPGAGLTGLAVPAAQAVTFYAPIPEGQQPGPHIPQVVFLIAAGADDLTAVAELATRPGAGDRHHLTAADIERLNTEEDGWIAEVDRWLTTVLQQHGQPAAAPGAFLQPHQPSAHGQPNSYRHPGQAYAYKGHQPYQYGGYQRRPGMGAAIAAGVGGAALGFLGGMVISDMIGDAFEPDVAAQAFDDTGVDSGLGGFEDEGFDI